MKILFVAKCYKSSSPLLLSENGIMSFKLFVDLFYCCTIVKNVVQTCLLRAVYLQQDFSQRAYHVEGTILFPGVRAGLSENLVAEAHSLLQHLNRARKTHLIKYELSKQGKNLFYFFFIGTVFRYRNSFSD